VLGGLLLLVLILGGAAVFLLTTGSASLSTDSAALARIDMPFQGGKITGVVVTTGPHARRVPVYLQGDKIWPDKLLHANQKVTIDVVVQRPSWSAWLNGKTQKLHMTMVTPVASLKQHYLTLKPGEPVTLRFKAPVRTFSYGEPGHLVRRELHSPLSVIKLKRTAPAGTAMVAAAPRAWEISKPAVISWFPAGSATATAVSSPAPGTSILPTSKITLTFSKTVTQALGSHRPPVDPTTPGTWHTINSHTIQFEPTGYGYGLGAHVSIGLPSSVRLIGGQTGTSSVSASYTVPGGSPMRLQQLLAELGYLPLSFHAKHAVPAEAQAQLNAAVKPPKGSFNWRWSNVPSGLRNEWKAGASGVMTKGAVMAFQSDHGLTTDGVAGPTVWKDLINAAAQGKSTKFGYTYVNVNKEASPETLTLWHSGKTVMTAPVNTGIPGAPTASGTFPVFEHVPVTTMSGTNPDGSTYSDPGIQWVSYFNGGDALHAFSRAQYGFPQSLGCVEMDTSDAGRVYPYTPIGTLVNVE
jgi:peptidoglycan hydrolase-like protein with peptidoglycan-binding domain